MHTERKRKFCWLFSLEQESSQSLSILHLTKTIFVQIKQAKVSVRNNKSCIFCHYHKSLLLLDIFDEPIQICLSREEWILHQQIFSDRSSMKGLSM